MAELERCVIIERVRAECVGPSWKVAESGVHHWTSTEEQIVIDRRSGMSLTQVAKRHCISTGERLPTDEGGDAGDPHPCLQEAVLCDAPVADVQTMQ